MITHYKPRKISTIAETDSKVVLVGNIISTGKNSFILDDGESRAEIISEKPVEKKFVKVFCSIVEDKLKADIIQSLEGIDLNLFKKVEELYNKAGI